MEYMPAYMNYGLGSEVRAPSNGNTGKITRMGLASINIDWNICKTNECLRFQDMDDYMRQNIIVITSEA